MAPRASPRFPFYALVSGALSALIAFLSTDPYLALVRSLVVFAAAVVLVRWAVARWGRSGGPPWLAWVFGGSALLCAVPVAALLVTDDPSAHWLSFALAVAALALAAVDRALPREPAPVRKALWVAVGLVALFGYPNFGHAHFGNTLHTWDAYHRYLTAKYQPELGLTQLYACTVVADVEAQRPPEPGARVTDLKHGGYIDAAVYTFDPDGACKSKFTAGRWEAFLADTAFFRGRVSERRWSELREDLGVHETPAWLAWSHGLASVFGPWPLVVLDGVWLALGAGVLFWAFGARGFAAGALLLGTNWALGFFYWTGGSLLRHEWLFLSIAAVCLLKKQRPALAGAALSGSALLIGFPLLMFGGPLLLAGDWAWKRTRLPPEWVRFFGGAAVALVLGAAVSTAWAGVGAWPQYFEDRATATPVTNHLGLGILLSYRENATGERLRDEAATDPWGAWKEARTKGLADTRVFQGVVVLMLLALLFTAVRRHATAPWLAVALSAGVVPLVLELTNFQYVLLVPLGAAAWLDRRVAGIAAALAAAGLYVSIAPAQYLSQWFDVQSAVLSALVIAAVAACWACFAWLKPDPDR